MSIETRRAASMRRASAAYARQAVRDIGYVDAEGKCLVVLCVHTDVPFDKVIEGLENSGESLLPLLAHKSKVMSARTFRDTKALT